MSKKIIALFGKAGSGKDTICRYLSQTYNINKLVRITTRPRREGEVEGIEYIFEDKMNITQRILDNSEQFIEIGVFNDWYYLTPADQVKEGWNITTCDVDAVRQMIENTNGIEVYPIYIDVDDKTRLIRALNRESNPNVKEIIRRYSSDDKDYSIIDFDYLAFNNSGYFSPIHIDSFLQKNNIDFNK